jgi:hypothetical protein
MQDRQFFEKSIRRFLAWLDHNGTSGYDPYDLWSTAYGVRARRLFYRYGGPAAVIAAPLVLADRIFPEAVRYRIKKKRYATSHAHLILGLLELKAAGFNENDHLSNAVALGEELDEIKISGYSGDCWGYPFDWENRRGLWPKNTPLITVTPYGFEANWALYKATENESYQNRARSVIDFALHDLNNTERHDGSIASSYSPLDNSLILNASAYRAFVLIAGAQTFSDEVSKELARKLVRFVINSQRDDGSWPYALEAKGDDFVDHFHTCFVLKNLAKIHELTGDAEILSAIENGYSYYENALFYNDALPRPFSVGGDRSLKYNLYDFAEAINLGILLRDRVPRAFDRALHVAQSTVERFQLSDGHFVTSVDRFGLRNELAFIRWPQAQLFRSLASLLKTLD